VLDQARRCGSPGTSRGGEGPRPTAASGGQGCSTGQPSTPLYQKGLDAIREHKESTNDPLEPTWGEPELLASLAWSNLNRTTPDLKAAEEYARAPSESSLTGTTFATFCCLRFGPLKPKGRKANNRRYSMFAVTDYRPQFRDVIAKSVMYWRLAESNPRLRLNQGQDPGHYGQHAFTTFIHSLFAFCSL